MFSIELVRQYRESQYVKAIAAEIVQKAGAEDTRSRVIALRDYLRERVTFRGAMHNDRSFLRATAGLNGIAERMPMKQYARRPFRVCVNDQFDRLAAPIEVRFTREEVEGKKLRDGCGAPGWKK